MFHPLQKRPRSCLERACFLIWDLDLGCWRAHASISDGGMGFAISPENFRCTADMRRAINGLCRPAALAFLGVDECDAVDLKKSLGSLNEISAAWLGLSTLFHGLFAGAGGLASSRVFRDPDLRSEVGASRQAVVAGKGEAAFRL